MKLVVAWGIEPCSVLLASFSVPLGVLRLVRRT
jgi:hypothetical protein